MRLYVQHNPGCTKADVFATFTVTDRVWTRWTKQAKKGGLRFGLAPNGRKGWHFDANVRRENQKKRKRKRQIREAEYDLETARGSVLLWCALLFTADPHAYTDGAWLDVCLDATHLIRELNEMTAEGWLAESEAAKVEIRAREGRLPRGWWLGQKYIDCARAWVEPIPAADLSAARRVLMQSASFSRTRTPRLRRAYRMLRARQ